jgi:predicted membrane-bound mannosyltransferase
MNVNKAKPKIEISAVNAILVLFITFAIGTGASYLLFRSEQNISKQPLQAADKSSLPITASSELSAPQSSIRAHEQPEAISLQEHGQNNENGSMPDALEPSHTTTLNLAELRMSHAFNLSRSSAKVTLRYQQQQNDFHTGQTIFESHWSVERITPDTTFITDGLNIVRIHSLDSPTLVTHSDEPRTTFYVYAEDIQKTETDLSEEIEFTEMDDELARLESSTATETENIDNNLGTRSSDISHDTSLSIYQEDILDEY